jgi:serine/threonine-protein kinase
MKICPTCQKTYPDDFSVCPRDATPLATQATETEAQLAAGLSRRFRIIRQLGKGGMGTVFLAEQVGVGLADFGRPTDPLLRTSVE